MMTEMNFVPLVLLACAFGYLVGWYFSKKKKYTVEIEFDTLDDIEAWRELQSKTIRFYREEEVREIVRMVRDNYDESEFTLDIMIDNALKKLHKK